MAAGEPGAPAVGHTRRVPGISATAAAQLTPHLAGPVRLPGEHGGLAALATLVPGAPVPPGVLGTVLMVPGYTGSKEDFAPLLDAVAGAGLAAVAIDLPGQYESAGPPDEASYLPAPLGTALVGLVRRLAPQPVILLGHSYGGLVCRAAVLAGAPVAGLVLMCSGPAALPDGLRRSLLDVAEPVLRTRGVLALQALREAADAGLPRRPPELATLMRRRFVHSSAAGLLGMATGLRTEPDRVAELAATLRAPATGATTAGSPAGGTPCLVTCGEFDDAWTPDLQRDMASRLGAPFATIAGAAHSPNVENPAGLLELLLPTWHGWLGRTVQRPA